MVIHRYIWKSSRKSLRYITNYFKVKTALRSGMVDVKATMEVGK